MLIALASWRDDGEATSGVRSFAVIVCSGWTTEEKGEEGGGGGRTTFDCKLDPATAPFSRVFRVTEEVVACEVEGVFRRRLQTERARVGGIVEDRFSTKGFDAGRTVRRRTNRGELSKSSSGYLTGGGR
jgi:hypothetical protein